MVAPVAMGEVIAGKYRVTGVIGEGGMGVVLAADHLQLEQPVAIKFLKAGASAETIERFAREAQTAAQIPSAHVTKVMDIDFLPSGEPYLVLERLEGEDLATLLHRSGPLSVRDAVEYVLQACEVVGQAHDRGIIHRDLKPANLFLTRHRDGSPCIKVLDFGISKLQDAELAASGGKALTATGAVMGSPVYMPPELWVSATRADARSDIWSLGVVLYELLIGEPPFFGEGVAQICRAVLDADPPSLDSRRADVPAGLNAAVMKCMVKRPDQRHASVVELVDALSPYAASSVEAVAREGAPRLGDARTSSAVAMASTVASDPFAPTSLAVSSSQPDPPAAAVAAITSPEAAEQAAPMMPAPATVADSPLVPARHGAVVERSASGRGIWLGLGALGLLVIVGAIVAAAWMFTSSRGRTAKGSKRRGAVPAATGEAVKGPARKRDDKDSERVEVSSARWTPAINHAPKIARNCWREMGKPPKAIRFVFEAEMALVDAVDAKDSSRHVHCRFLSGATSLSEPMALPKGELDGAFPFSSVKFVLARRLARDAQRRFPKHGKADQVVLARFKGKVHWVVTLGAERTRKVLYDQEGNYRSSR